MSDVEQLAERIAAFVRHNLSDDELELLDGCQFSYAAMELCMPYVQAAFFDVFLRDATEGDFELVDHAWALAREKGFARCH